MLSDGRPSSAPDPRQLTGGGGLAAARGAAAAAAAGARSLLQDAQAAPRVHRPASASADDGRGRCAPGRPASSGRLDGADAHAPSSRGGAAGCEALDAAVAQRQQVSGGGSGGKGVQPAPPAAGEGSGGGGHPVSAKKRPGGRGARLLQQAASMPGQRLLCFLPAAAPAAAAAAAATTPLPRGPRDAPTGMNSEIREVLRTIQQMPQTQSAGAPSRKRGSPDASAFITASAAAAHLSPCGGAAALHFSSDRRASFSGGKGAGCGRGGDGSDDKYRVIGGARGCCSGDEEDEEEEEEDEETIERRLAARIASHRSKRLRRLMGAVPAASQPRWLV
ncbi:hypothetical protein MNEG_6426 [Monoraphidium neglectum]|uniref:Uncharacterized protein n=1 Tax=Monoraphidium neglectum TaxID=145388 RepID=A0A0D2MLV8_9CHLO|nr:hypothetical protein MNEG_6426 [Monoraphidium neglectum]KIZ01537.1 hypothetical protein MNEG_6426 [Monoraphidium neglectum]|eukprot:XP_013900556.1 hypothetical protein MNEG_6426 [Monoraphidium neglectum]